MLDVITSATIQISSVSISSVLSNANIIAILCYIKLVNLQAVR